MMLTSVVLDEVINGYELQLTSSMRAFAASTMMFFLSWTDCMKETPSTAYFPVLDDTR